MKNTQTKIEKDFFEVEGIKSVFDGIHIGERFSYGYVAYFTKEVCLDIISKCEHTLTIKFNNDLDLFEESFEEEGEILTNFSSKLQVFGITYYQIGNGWSWEISNEQRLNLYKMNPKRLEEKLSWLHSFYDIWHKSQSIDDSAINNLSQVYIDYCNEWGLPQLACDELICEINSILND
jgi:hypothetical protein